MVGLFISFLAKVVESEKKWILNGNGHQIFGKNIQSVKPGKCVQFEMNFENML